MATTDAWLGGTHSFSVSRNWSDGVPTSDSNVVIPSGDARVTSPFAVNAVQVKAAGTMTFVDAGATRTMAGSINSGTLALDTLSGQGGGSSLDIGGALKNYGLLQVGASDGSLSAADKVSVVSLVNDKNGVISLDGGGSALAGLVVGSTAGFGTQGLLTGDVSLGGYARLTFAGTGADHQDRQRRQPVARRPPGSDDGRRTQRDLQQRVERPCVDLGDSGPRRRRQARHHPAPSRSARLAPSGWTAHPVSPAARGSTSAAP